MKTKTTKHELAADTVTLARSLKRLERRPDPNRLVAWMADEIRKELCWRAAHAMAEVRP